MAMHMVAIPIAAVLDAVGAVWLCGWHLKDYSGGISDSLIITFCIIFWCSRVIMQ